MRYNNRERSHALNFSIKTIWGIAKSRELLMSDEDLYSIIYRETGKDSMRKLNQKEIGKVCSTLLEMKDSVSIKSKTGRTDTGGNKLTISQRRKIYKLTGELGWNNNNARINGFVKKMFNTERLEWLDKQQCNSLIEMLKSMVERENSKKDGGSDGN